VEGSGAAFRERARTGARPLASVPVAGVSTSARRSAETVSRQADASRPSCRPRAPRRQLTDVMPQRIRDRAARAELGMQGELFVASRCDHGERPGICQRNPMRKLRRALDLIAGAQFSSVRTRQPSGTLRIGRSPGGSASLGVTHYHIGAHAELRSGSIERGDIDFRGSRLLFARRAEAEHRLLRTPPIAHRRDR
jgi:hypothetical protein